MVLGHTRISRGSLHLFSHHCFPLRLILYPKLWFRDIHSPVFYGRKNTTETRAFGPNCHTYFPIRRNCLHIGVAQLQIKLAFAPKKKIPQYLVFLNSTSRAKIKLIMIKKKKLIVDIVQTSLRRILSNMGLSPQHEEFCMENYYLGLLEKSIGIFYLMSPLSHDFL